VFLSIGIFTVLNSVSSNISSEYSRITTSGKLHDFTVSENYVIGNAKYDFAPEDFKGLSSDNQPVP
jgi:hypothetical protein